MPISWSKCCRLRDCFGARARHEPTSGRSIASSPTSQDIFSADLESAVPRQEPSNPFSLVVSQPSPSRASSSPLTAIPAAPRSIRSTEETGLVALHHILRSADGEENLSDDLRSFIETYAVHLYSRGLRQPLARQLAARENIYARLKAALPKRLEADAEAIRLFLDLVSPDLSANLRAALMTGHVNDKPTEDPYGLKQIEPPLSPVHYPVSRAECPAFFASFAKVILPPAECVDTKSIPPFIHFVWLGRPFEQKQFSGISSFVACNPEYEVVLWTDAATCESAGVLQSCQQAGVRLLSAAAALSPLLVQHGLDRHYQQALIHEQYAAASDILRIVILHTFGGTYSDVDRTCISPLAPLRDHQLVLWGEGNAMQNSIHNSDFMMSIREHLFLQRAMTELKENRPTDPAPSTINRRGMATEDEVIIDWTGPSALCRALPSDTTSESLHYLTKSEIGGTSFSSTGPRQYALRDNDPSWTRSIIDGQEWRPTCSQETLKKRLITCMLDDWRDFGRIDPRYYRGRLSQLSQPKAVFDEVVRQLLDMSKGLDDATKNRTLQK